MKYLPWKFYNNSPQGTVCNNQACDKCNEFYDTGL